jgi:hypothetical protein
MSHRILPVFLFVSFSAWAQAPQPPTALTVRSATAKSVQLAWTASADAKSYGVQRKSGGDYATVLPAATTSATDNTIDPYTTYTYRVVAINDNGTSSATNEVTVGPPPYGFQTVLKGPTDDTVYHFAVALRMVLDTNGDPAMAYIMQDPNNDGDDNDSTLHFLSWNRAAYAWNAPVKVATPGLLASAGERVGISLALDADKSVWGIAYAAVTGGDSGQIALALSTDGGLTWTPQTVASDTYSGNVAQPSLAMAGGQVHLAYARHGTGILYVTGKQGDDPAKWTSQPAPAPGGYTTVQEMVSLALDSNGAAGLAYVVSSDRDSAEAFWRPAGGGAAVVLAANNGHTTDNPDIQLSFYGTEPRAVFTPTRDDSNDWDHSVWAARASGTGGNWLPAVNVPSDQQISLVGPVSITTGSRGQTAIAVSTNGGVGTGTCGFPKISRSDDFVAFKTCGIAPAGDPDFAQVQWPVARFGGNDKLWVTFRNPDMYGQIPTGIILWREP